MIHWRARSAHNDLVIEYLEIITYDPSYMQLDDPGFNLLHQTLVGCLVLNNLSTLVGPFESTGVCNLLGEKQNYICNVTIK